MGRSVRTLLALGVIVVMTAGPAAAQETEPVIDLSEFIATYIGPGPGGEDLTEDRNGDGIPDIPIGIPGIWDEQEGAATPAEFADRVSTGAGFDLSEAGSTLVGPCGGVVISYDNEGNSIDAAVDFADAGPPVDIYGEPTFQAGRPFKVRTDGVVAFYGFTLDTAPFSTAGVQAGVNYGDPAPAFHDHQWQLDVMEIAADFGGDPNQRDKNRNAGLLDLGGVLGEESGATSIDLPFDFRAKVKARGAIIDLWGPERLPDFDGDTIAGLAGGNVYCYGEGWVEFVGDGFPLFTAPGALATALAAAGFAGLLFNARPALSWRA
jgi:hypothetical protein